MPPVVRLWVGLLRSSRSELGLTLGQFALSLAVAALICLIAFFGALLFSEDYREAVFPAFR